MKQFHLLHPFPPPWEAGKDGKEQLPWISLQRKPSSWKILIFSKDGPVGLELAHGFPWHPLGQLDNPFHAEIPTDAQPEPALAQPVAVSKLTQITAESDLS